VQRSCSRQLQTPGILTGLSILRCLQATEHAADYGIAQARQAFEVLAPALRPGMPAKPVD